MSLSTLRGPKPYQISAYQHTSIGAVVRVIATAVDDWFAFVLCSADGVVQLAAELVSQSKIQRTKVGEE